MDFLTKEMIYQKSSQELTALLYEAAVTNLKTAIKQLENQQYIEANQAMQKVNDILHRLGVGLNYESGIIADQLDALYNYMADQLIEANIKKDASLAKEILTILEEITGAWTATMKAKPTLKQSSFRKQSSAYEKHVMVSDRELNTVEVGK
nr:flagellar export chaperone FliS [Bacillus wudalianchiensis]